MRREKGICALLALLLLVCLLPGLSLAEGCITYLGSDDARPALGRDDLLEVHLINVQAADCILLRMGELTMLIDSGRAATYERVTKYLSDLGIEKLDYAFATHPHDDHIGGYLKILKEVPCDLFMQPYRYEDYKGTEAKQLAKLLTEKNIPLEMVPNDTIMQFGGATLTFMQWQYGGARENNRSMIVKVQYGDRSILLSADTENNAQRGLAEEYGDKLKADILKMPHHGLATYMLEYHNVVQPELSTFSNVKAKIYDVLRSCEKRGVKWMLTTKGTITCVTDGAIWTVWQ